MGKKSESGYPGVYPKGSGIRLEFTWNKKRYRPYLPWEQTPDNYAKAAKIYNSIKAEIKLKTFDQGRLESYFPEFAPQDYRQKKIFTFGEMAERYMKVCQLQTKTFNNYAGFLNNRWLPFLGHRPIHEITVAELREVIAEHEFPSTKNKNDALIPMRRVFALAVDYEVIDSNPGSRIKGDKNQTLPPDPFEQNEVELIIDHLYKNHTYAEQVYPAYFEFAFFTGLRPQEMLALRWGDIDWRLNLVRVNKVRSQGEIRNSTKTNTARDVYLTDQALHALRVMKPITYMSDSYIFMSPRYRDQGWATEKAPRVKFQETLRKLGLRYRRAYNTRHTYATYMLMKGVNPAFAAKQMGHSVMMFFQVYSRWIDGAASEAEMAKLREVNKPVLQVVK